MTITVIIPTYKRIDNLKRCLDSLRKQTLKADEVIVVAEDRDNQTQDFLKTNSYQDINLKVVINQSSGQVDNLNKGKSGAKGDIIVMTDDDIVARSDWLEKIKQNFKAHDEAGAVGGRDYLYFGDKFIDGKAKEVGKITWYGKIIGNHHFGYGEARYVDHLKGTNMSFRSKAIEGIDFDVRLKGSGAQVRNDTAFCLAVKKKGWKLLYDPAVVVEHYVGQRHEPNKRGNYDWVAVEAGAFNETLVLFENLSFFRKIAYLFFVFFIGNIFTPGILQAIRIIPRERGCAFLRLCAAFKGRWQALKASI